MPTMDPEKIREKNARYNVKREDNRTRVFATVVYPESAPADWKEILADQHVTALISPLHDKDVNPDGQMKKPHHHVMVLYEGKKTYETQVKPLFDAIGGVGREMVNSTRGYARYLCHLDNPEKAQYSTSDVVALGGADYHTTIHLPTDNIKAQREIERLITANDIRSYAELCDVLYDLNQDLYYAMTTRLTTHIGAYLRAWQWEFDSNYVRMKDRVVVDPATGELLNAGGCSND